MKGDILVIEEHHRRVAQVITQKIIDKIRDKSTRYIITVAGESGSGKSETGKAIADEFEKLGIKSVILGQDDYFYFPPKSNDTKRKKDLTWLGPHKEVKLDVIEKNLVEAITGAEQIVKPLIDYDGDTIEEETITLKGTKVVIAEGTYTTLLKNVDTKIFIDRNRLDTLDHRQKRNRGNEVGDPFIEDILKREHKIITEHKQFADIIINKDYRVVE